MSTSLVDECHRRAQEARRSAEMTSMPSQRRIFLSWSSCALHAVAGAGVSGSMVRGLMLEAVELRFAMIQAPHAVEWLSDNGSPFTAKETLDCAAALGLVPCFTPGAQPGVKRHR
jgi:transposase InsO family protein